MKRELGVVRRIRGSRSTWSTGAAQLALAATAAAQTYDWSPRFGTTSPNSFVYTIRAIDDPSGAGQIAYVGGTFTSIGGCRARNIARWDGAAWSALGDGLSHDPNYTSWAYSVAQFDAGAGPEIIVGGFFTKAGGQSALSIARWNGAAWAPLSGPSGQGLVNAPDLGSVTDLHTFDDGSGSEVWVTGRFTSAGGVAAKNVARWNGTDWLPAGDGVGQFFSDGSTFEVFDDGAGPRLYLGGNFDHSGTTPVDNIARWNGAGWEQVGSGLDGDVRALAVFDDGTGAKLYAAGGFPGFVASWDGVQWSTVGGGADNVALELTVFDDGSGPALIAGGAFDNIGGVRVLGMAKWDGSSWSSFGGLPYSFPEAVEAVDFGPHGGRKLLIGGTFSTVGPVTGTEIAAQYIAQWDGSAWSAVLPIDGDGASAPVFALHVHDDGRGDALYAGGTFARVGTQTVNNIARWDGDTWEALGTGTSDNVLALESFDDGGGNSLYVGGAFASAGGIASEGLARWDGVNWSTIGGCSHTYDSVDALQAFDDGSGDALYVGGYFTNIGGVHAVNVARWNGSTWSPLGTGIDANVRALAVFDDGSGPALYAGGGTGGGSVNTGRLVRWNGTTWVTVGGGVDDYVLALQVFDDGSGPALYVGGELLVAGGNVAVDHLGRWNGSSWSAVLSTPLERRVRALTVYDEGAGPRLYLGGQSIGGGIIGRVEGAQLIELRERPGGQVHALAEFDDGRSSLPALYVGGGFEYIGAFRSENIARWADSNVAPATSYCTAGTTANGCTATIAATGEPSRCMSSGFDVSVTGIEGQKLGILFFGFGSTATHWGSGTSYVCVAPPTTRASTQTSGGTVGACDGSFALDFNAWMYANPFKSPAPGTNTFMQAWFRDPPSAKGTSLSDALRFEVAP